MTDFSKAVFLSYASQDAEAAKRICDTLRASGVPVWLDADGGLEHGDEWDAKIRRQIKECVLFIPLISASTQARHEGYFRIEWELAAQRALGIASGVAFILPVVIDDTKEPDALVPDKFRTVQWTRLRPVGYAGQARLPGELPPEVLQRFLKLWSHRTGALNHEAGSMAAGPETVAGGDPAPGIDHRRARSPGLQERSGSRALIATAAAVVVLGLGAAFWFTRSPNAHLPSPGAAVPAATITRPPPHEKSIAILPFRNESPGATGTESFADGMNDALITSLINIPELRVATQESVAEFRGSDKKPPEIGNELGVRYLLTSTVSRSGSRIRVSSKLIRAATNEYLWAKDYTRDLSVADIFEIHAALAGDIATALRAVISPETRKLIATRPTENLAAYDLYLQATSIVLSSRVARTRAVGLLEEAVKLDQRFAAAWGYMAGVQALLFREYDPTPARFALAEAAMRRALELDPENAEVQMNYGTYLYRVNDFDRARAVFRALLVRQPANAYAVYGLGQVDRYQGRWSDALANYHAAVALSAGVSTADINIQVLLRAGRRWAELNASEQARPGGPLPSNLAAFAFYAKGSLREYEAWQSGLSPEQREAPSNLNDRKTWAIRAGDVAEWRRLDARQRYYEDTGDPHWLQDLDAATYLASIGDGLAARNRIEPHLAFLQVETERQPENVEILAGLARIEALLGQKDSALRHARVALELRPAATYPGEHASLSYRLVTVQAWTGDKDAALAGLAEVLRAPAGRLIISVHLLRASPAMFPLRGDPRFETLLNDPKNNAPLF